MHCGKLIDEATGEQVPHCRVCGAPAVKVDGPPSTHRCEKHIGRNPCAIEGCKRSCDDHGRPDDGTYWLCGTHWKIGVPPRSRLRRQYHRYFRKAKRHGWDTRAGSTGWMYRQRFYRFWRTILLPAARKACEEGRIDVEEIHRMFGWDPPE